MLVYSCTYIYRVFIASLDVKKLQKIFLFSHIDLKLFDPLMVFRVAPWKLLFPFFDALGSGNALLKVVDEVNILSCLCGIS